jgi:hypothetical protein
MAHFAKVEDGIVTQVVVTDNDFPNDGYDWLIENFGGTWIQTSYNARIRGKFAGIGDAYNSELDEFVAPIIEEEEALNE